MTLYLDLPGSRGKLDRLVSEFGAVVLPGPPDGLDAVPPGKALVCVGDMVEYEAAGYILTEEEFALAAVARVAIDVLEFVDRYRGHLARLL